MWGRIGVNHTVRFPNAGNHPETFVERPATSFDARRPFPAASMPPRSKSAFAVGLVLLVTVSSVAFAADVSDARRPDPVAFEDTVTFGMTGEEAMSSRTGATVAPRAEVFYSQYRYVVGYYGVTWMVDEVSRPEHERQFGVPVAVYVTDFRDSDVTLDGDGVLTVPDGKRPLPWTAVEDAHFVVGSRARTLSGPAVVPFSTAAAARSFADEHDGRVVRWEAVRDMEFGTTEATRQRFRNARSRRAAWANRTADDARALLSRPVSVVVGEDAPTVRAAVERAPANTTVYVPEGTYAGNVTVDKPLTVRGAGEATHLRGDGTGSVVRARAPRTAVADLRVSGVGNTTSVAELPDDVEEGEWDYQVKMGYAYGDAGVVLDRANGSLIHGVSVETPTNGVLVRSSSGSVLEELTVRGAERWQDGFMDVTVMHSRIVVQNSTFRGGRDAVYTHRSHGVVVRGNYMDGMRFGVHEMYTSNALVADNAVRNTISGVIVMTRPTGNVIVDNDVRESRQGVGVVGSASYVAGNVLADNDYGMAIGTQRSLYEHNVLANNDVGARASDIVPTNRVVANDFVGNDRYVVAVVGPLRVWTAGGRGNYWSGAPGVDADGDGTLDRTFRPSGPVDGAVHRASGAPTLARSPATAALRGVRDLAPGLRGTGVVDTGPLADPVRPEAVNETEGA
jgi:nitrous oxidase accessory protein NosD/nitrous oxide reductase accessory protein NosL